ncbi:hypothetical protein Desca_0013 [Desulfotomaculum nigrificans CO-1-SRB]|uniref:Cyclic lactone autoinducer peptide n=1 Tax=Desulfotomaculum nigrificans (strain DSM 14880 / VKM B-2319 / CO-1-SRB) TaxID=868595 RepID=F6B3V3_DESCC|nr:cyclic lactone autoinducer peptide [Desulfotomaculum nigrificans]AEF92918.1 hypothetical protein Desca_0013 [Desulfotomaculum nigrificans CO-1-SRB]
MKTRVIFLLSTVLFFVAQVNANITCLFGHYEPEIPDSLR